MTNIGASSSQFSFAKGGLLPQEEMLEVEKKQKEIIIGIPKESQKNESRIGLTPLGIELLINNGHQVIIESNAGKAANFQDRDLSESGAFIVKNKPEVFKSDIILKVAPFSFEEIDLFKEKQTVISALHITSQSEEYVRKLMQKKVTAIAGEYLKDSNNCYPVVQSMSEIAGNTSILIAAEYLSNVHDGKGEMLGGITGLGPSQVVIIGAGTAGEYAARTALGLGAKVKVFDSSNFKLRRLQNNLSQRISTSIFYHQILRKALESADVVIGAMQLIYKGPQYIVTEDMVRNMKSGSVIIDISIDQGGCFETSELTSHNNPVFQKHGVVHYCVPNISSRVARTASYALSNIFAPILLNIGKTGGIKQLLKEDAGVRHGIYIYNGILTNNYIGNLFQIPSKDIDLLMAAF